MATPLSITKSGTRSVLVEALFNEIVSNTGNYYHFIGKALPWDTVDDIATAPENTVEYETATRERIVFMKKITSSDVAFIIPRYNWVSGHVYDMYDDYLGGKLVSDAIGSGTTSALSGDFSSIISEVGIGWTVEGEGIDEQTSILDITSSSIVLSKPIVGPVESISIINTAPSGAKALENSRFYVLTNERNVYKCLYNNKGAPSTVKPYSTTNEVIYTDDGYIWKFMYTIPNALANKFLTPEDMPVTTSLRSGYYSQGAINSVTIQSYGQTYLPTDQLSVIGDGHASESVYRIVGINVIDQGDGYLTEPVVVITPPYTTVDFLGESTAITGQYIKADNRIYRAISGGQLGITTPIHTAGTADSGNVPLLFVAAVPEFEVVIDDSKLQSIDLTGIVGRINLTSVGIGYDYLNPPSVTINDDTGTGATAFATVSPEGYLTRITISNRGVGYSPAATISIDAPPIVDAVWAELEIVSNGDIIQHLGNLYEVVSEGVLQELGTVPPTHVQGTLTNGDVELAYYGQAASAQVEIYYGFGYNNTPNLTIAPPVVHDTTWVAEGTATLGQIVKSSNNFYEVTTAGVYGINAPVHTSGTVSNGTAELEFIGKSAIASLELERTQASITPVIENGQIVNVVINDPGIGYTFAEIIIQSSSGINASIIPNLGIGDLNTRQAITEILSVPGTIEVIDVLNPGSEYTSESAVVTVTGDGTGCTASAIIERGRIARIDVLTPGVGYTKASVQIGTSSGRQAYARAIVSPYRGHGKNAVQELNAQTIALASTIASDKNQGFVVDNDYRQLGVIKDPALMGVQRRFTGFSASTCYNVTAIFTYSEINSDDTITDELGNRYVVIAKPTVEPAPGEAFPILLQSIDNVSPTDGELFIYSNGTLSATASKITQPDVDKYSGTILFIDNRSPFQPTDQQTIAIKTVIRL